MSTKSKGYPLFGAPFNTTTNYGFDAHSLVTSFVMDEQKPSIHENHHWACTDAYCLYQNKDGKTNHNTDYISSNPIDIINTSCSDFICHSTGSDQSILRICEWNDKKLKHGHTFSLPHQIEGITHCHSSFNNETVILSWNRYCALYLGMKHDKPYKFEEIETFEAPSNTIFKCGIICCLPFVWNSGMEDSVFFTSNGSLIFTKNNGDIRTEIDLKYQQIPQWTQLIWTQHPRIIRFSCDIEMLTIDLRVNINKKHFKCAQKHLYFDPITAITSYKHYISTVGMQGLALYDDRMINKPLSKWTFYDFDFSVGDALFSRLQIYPIHNEYWIICSGKSQRIHIYPFFAKNDSPITPSFPFNINKYCECFGGDIGINGVFASLHKDKHHIIVTSSHGTMLCTSFELKENQYVDNMDLMELKENLVAKKDIFKRNIVWNTLLNDNKYMKEMEQSKVRYIAAQLEPFAQDILEFTLIPRTIEDIYHEFKDVLHDLADITLFDYFAVFCASDIGLNMFEIQSITDIHDIDDDDINENMLKVINTYFVSQRLDETGYIDIEDMNNNDDKEQVFDGKDIINIQEKDELDLDEFFALSEMAATQEPDIYNNDNTPIYNDNTNYILKDKLFITHNDITDKCHNVLDSLCHKWIKGENQYVVCDWRIQNGNNIHYNGMLEKKGYAPKRMHRKIKRVWS